MKNSLKNGLAFIPSLAFNALFVILVLTLFIKADFPRGFIFFSPYYVRILTFTFFQAFGGAVLSFLLAFFLLPAVQNLPPSFLGKGIRTILTIPFFLPSIIGCLALIGVFGQAGLVALCCEVFGLSYKTFLYGIYGILLCHVFYYTPFILQAFDKTLVFLPGEARRLGSLLGMGPFSQFRFLYYPLLKEEIPTLFSLVFLYCLRSFTTVLIFGGTLHNTTLEVGIFQALNFDADWQVAAQLSLAQLSLAGFVSLFPKRKAKAFPLQPEFHSFYVKRPTIRDGLAYFVIFCLFFLPLFSVIFKGLPQLGVVCLTPHLWESLLNSLLIGFLSFFFTLLFVAPLVYTAYQFPHLAFFAGELPAKLTLIFSPLLIAFLFYALFDPFMETYRGFLFILSSINGIVFAPHVYPLLLSSYRLQREKHEQLCAQLNISGLWRWRYIDAQGLKKAVGYTWALCMIFAMGDTRVIFLFNKGYFPSLTLFLYDKMRTYEFAQAAAIGVFMILVAAFILWTSEKIFGKYRP